MDAPNFSGLAAFIAVARNGNFRRAAQEQGVSRSALSHAVRLLEESLGVRLFNRTTRSVALTAAGERLFARLEPAFAEIGQAVDELNAFRDTPAGLLKISTPRSAARLVLGPLVAKYLRAYPHMRLEIIDDDALVDIVARGFDAGIRFGERLEGDMVAVPIGPAQRFAVVAAPSYFKAHETPLDPRDLRRQTCIRHRFPSGVIFRWEFEKDGHALEVEVDGPLLSGSLDLTLQAALDGLGLAMVFEADAAPHVKRGRLRRVLEDWTPAFPGFFLYYPSRRHISAGLRAFIEMARSRRRG
jgi:DNA-binding transcriptional LysR family regulator